MSVYKKLHQVQAATRSLAANADGQTGGAKYAYVSGAKLLSVIRPMMDKLGLILTQEVLGITNDPITYSTRNGEKTEMFTTTHIRFTWIDVEDGSTLVNEFYANGMNSWDKGLGSALTYAERYYLMKTFHIATDEDDIDAIVKDEAVKEKKQTRKQTPAPAPAASAPASDPAQPQYNPVTPAQYWKIVKAYAEGKVTKSGGDYRTEWARATNAGTSEILKFDKDVADFKAGQSVMQKPF